MIRVLRLAATCALCVAAVGTVGCAPAPPAGDGGTGGPPGTDAAPVMRDFAIAPTVLAMDGGDVLFRAIATDDTGVAAVVFTVTLPDGSTADYEAEPQGDDFYTHVYAAEYNPGDTDMTYSVVARVTDDSGQSATSSPLTFVVEPAIPPPDPPD